MNYGIQSISAEHIGYIAKHIIKINEENYILKIMPEKYYYSFLTQRNDKDYDNILGEIFHILGNNDIFYSYDLYGDSELIPEESSEYDKYYKEIENLKQLKEWGDIRGFIMDFTGVYNICININKFNLLQKILKFEFNNIGNSELFYFIFNILRNADFSIIMQSIGFSNDLIFDNNDYSLKAIFVSDKQIFKNFLLYLYGILSHDEKIEIERLLCLSKLGDCIPKYTLGGIKVGNPIIKEYTESQIITHSGQILHFKNNTYIQKILSKFFNTKDNIIVLHYNTFGNENDMRNTTKKQQSFNKNITRINKTLKEIGLRISVIKRGDNKYKLRYTDET